MPKERAEVWERLRWCLILPINREQEKLLAEAEDAFDAQDYQSAAEKVDRLFAQLQG